MTKPEYLVCQKCNNRLKENYEYFYLTFVSGLEVIGKCEVCKTTFNRVI